MSKNTKFLVFILFILTILFAGNYLRIVLNENRKQDSMMATGAQPTLTKQHLVIGAQEMDVEMAKSVVEQAVGLSFRESLGSDGMLFILPEPQRAGFWMKDMKFNIDIVWIEDGQISQITADVPADSYELKRQVFYPDSPVDWVLELPAGQATKLGLKVGDLVFLK